VAGVENALTQAVLMWLRNKGCYVWRSNTGAYKTDDRFIRFGTPGQPDVLGIVGDGTGRLLAVEVKAEKGRLSINQHAFLVEVRQRGGLALVVRPSDWEQVLADALGATP
jgi:hypothetical protein